MAEWRINHDRKGLEIEFPSKPAATVIAALKQNGFRWARASGVWYGKDYTHRREFLNTLATQGEDVQASGLSFAEKLEDKTTRAEERQERYETAAERAQTEADRRFGTAHRIADGIPFGQPILVGHHSERRHRWDADKIDNNMRKGIEASRQAEDLAHRAAAAGSQVKGYDNPAFLQRRIGECEAEIRRLDKNKAHYSSETDSWQRYREETVSKLDYCRQRPAELGGVKYGPHNVRVGDKVIGRFGPAIVRKINKLTVTVDYASTALGVLGLGCKLEFERIKQVLPT